MAPGTGPDNPTHDGRRLWGLVLVGALVVLLFSLVAVGMVTAGGNGESDAAASPDPGADDERERRSTTTDGAASTTSTTTTTTPTTTARPATVTGVAGSFEVALPPGWGSTAVSGDTTGAGAAMFPDDTEHASLADTAIGILATPQTVFLAMDGEGPAEVATTDMFVVEHGPSVVDQDAAYQALVRSMDAVQIEREGHAPTAAGEADWLEFTSGVAGIVGRKYLLVREGTAWVLTYWSGAMAERTAIADQIAASFRVV